jgi:hypothetical protein
MLGTVVDTAKAESEALPISDKRRKLMTVLGL